MEIKILTLFIKNFKGIKQLGINFGQTTNIFGENATGKAQPLTAKVLTNKGFVDIGNIEIGDKIFSNDGKLTEVIGVFPQGEKPCYKVTLLDGRQTECCNEHLWSVYTSRLNLKTITLQEMIDKHVEYWAYPNGVYNRDAAEELDKHFKMSFILLAKRDSIYPLQTVRRMIVPSDSPERLLRRISTTFN